MALKKSQLYSSLWQSCDELRGGMDASQYKDYVLTLLFMKYVSDKYADDPHAVIKVPDGGGYADMVQLRGDKEIGDKINKIISRLAEANDLKGVIDQADFNDESKLGAGKEMQDRLSKLIAIFDELDFRANRTEGDDLLGDAYEYLMRHFATESGKAKGQFYTPAEVSRIMAKVVGIGQGTRPEHTIYDPTCGSGSLLLKAADEAPDITVYGQEMDNATWALARMNMILHDHPTAELWRGNTLAAPYFKNPDDSLKTFDFAVANPPFSAKAWSNGLDPAHDRHRRFAYGIPPAKNGDYAFLLHLITSLKSTGKGAIILPHGVLFRGNREADIRRNLIRRGFIKGIIGLPANLFYGTGIPACILVIDKETAAARRGIFMVDASRGFLKDGNKNRLRAQDIHRIVDVFNRQLEVPRYSRMVPVVEIAGPANDCNLNIPRYVDASEPDDLHDLDAHLNGGIPDRDLDALDAYWSVFPALRQTLFQANGRSGYSDPRVEPHRIKDTIADSAEFTSYRQRASAIFDAWYEKHRRLLLGIDAETLPGTVIHTLSEDLLARFADLPLLDRYDVYQRLMDYWDTVMQDDVYLIAAAGWGEAAKPRVIFDDRDRRIKETPDITIKRKKYRMDLIPPALIVARWFTSEQAGIEKLRDIHESAARKLEDFVEEHLASAGGEDGVLMGIANSRGKITKAAATGRLKTICDAPEGDEEQDILMRCLELIDAESRAGKAAREAQAALDRVVLDRYATLTVTEIKALVIDDKWRAGIEAAIADEIQRLTQLLAGRVRQLMQRYARPLPEMENESANSGVRVAAHLNRMGNRFRSSRSTMSTDWEVKRLGDIASFFLGSGLSKRDLSSDGKRRCIHYGELVTTYGERITEILHGTNREEGFFQSVSNDVLMPTSGETPDVLATASCIMVDNVIIGSGILVIRASRKHLNGEFLAYVIKAHRNQILQLVSGTTVFHLYGRDMASFRFAAPSVQEQTAIVNALSDVDTSLRALDLLITKKRFIKRSVMQQLLTGKARLPGFDRRWTPTTLGDAAEIVSAPASVPEGESAS